jgi:phenylalanyl-tRNA synthetase beta subunit
VRLDADWTNRFLGTDISEDFMVKALRKLDFKVEDNLITVPSYRGDVSQKADIAEEVARMFGYDRIPVRADARRDGARRPYCQRKNSISAPAIRCLPAD